MIVHRTKQNKNDEVKLSHRQKRFCQELILNPKNATQAYISAGYSARGAGQSAEKLLKNTEIKKYVSQLQTQVNKKYEISRERIMRERSMIAFFRTDMLYDNNGELLDPSQWPEEVSAVVSSVKVRRLPYQKGEEPAEIVEVRMHSKDSSLQALEKIKGIYEIDNKQKNKRDFEDMTDKELESAIKQLEQSFKGEIR